MPSVSSVAQGQAASGQAASLPSNPPRPPSPVRVPSGGWRTLPTSFSGPTGACSACSGRPVMQVPGGRGPTRDTDRPSQRWPGRLREGPSSWDREGPSSRDREGPSSWDREGPSSRHRLREGPSSRAKGPPEKGPPAGTAATAAQSPGRLREGPRGSVCAGCSEPRLPTPWQRRATWRREARRRAPGRRKGDAQSRATRRAVEPWSRIAV
jgi:hypothetical protein